MAGVGLAVGLGVWLLWSQLAARGFDWRLTAASISRLQWSWLLVALGPIYATYLGRALRWRVFLRPVKPHPSVWQLTVATVIGFTAITLFGRAGDFVRPYLIAVKEKVPVTSQMAAWLLERVFDLLMASLLLGFALSKIHASGVHVGPALTWVLTFGGRVVGAGCAAVLAVLLSLRHFAEPVRRKVLAVAEHILPEARYRKAEAMINSLVQGVESTKSDAALLLILAYSAAEWVLIAGCYFCLAKAFSGLLTFTFVDILILLGFVSFGGVVQIPGIGGGTQVAAALVLTELFGIQLEVATLFAFLLWIITFVVIVPIGLILALKEGLDWHSLRQIGREAAE